MILSKGAARFVVQKPADAIGVKSAGKLASPGIQEPGPGPDPENMRRVTLPHPTDPENKPGKQILVDCSRPNRNLLTPNDLWYLLPNTMPKRCAWQMDFHQLAGGFIDPKQPLDLYNPTDKRPWYCNVQAINGAGKDSYLIAPLIVWFLWHDSQTRVVCTSSSLAQVSRQTFKYCRDYCEYINERLKEEVFLVRHHYIVCTRTGSEAIFFKTDEQSKAEGFHPLPGGSGKMLVVVNEAKSIPDPLWTGFLRWTGFTHWLEISSAGSMRGHFYERCMRAKREGRIRGTKMELGKYYHYRVNLADCPYLQGAHTENLKEDAKSSELIKKLVQQSIDNEFTDEDSLALLPDSLWTYSREEVRLSNLTPRTGGLDLSLGGAETVLYVVEGCRVLGRESTREKNTIKLAMILTGWFRKYQLKGEDIFGDAGGLGKPVLHYMETLGYRIHGINNEKTARNKKHYANIASENWARVYELAIRKLIERPEDEMTRDQLASRHYTVEGGVIKLESKDDMKERGIASPDRGDAYVLAWMRAPIPTATKEEMTAEMQEEVAKTPIDPRFQIISPFPASGKDLAAFVSTQRNTPHSFQQFVTSHLRR